MFRMDALVNLHESYNLVDILNDRDYERIFDHFHSLFGLDQNESKCEILSIDLAFGKVHCKYESVNFTVYI